MQFVTEFGTFVLTAYLAFSNLLAGYISIPFSTNETDDAYTIPNANEEAGLTRLESTFGSAGIPNILIQNAAFQQTNLTAALPDASVPLYELSDTVVNIYCTYQTDKSIRATTGSGFFISPGGAILTNAHVAQFLLLEQSKREGETKCVVRTGTPATTQYEAKLLYIPPAWISANANLIDAETPRGTGERDYALLYASASLTETPMPARFPYIAIDPRPLRIEDRGAAIAVAGYPANPLYEYGVEAELLFVEADSTITDLFTFMRNTPDMVSVYDTPVSTGGSSGGPVVDAMGRAIGVIVTRGETPEDSLRALTTSYVDRTIKEETGFGLTAYLQGDLSLRAAVFEEALAPFLLRLLEFELDI